MLQETAINAFQKFIELRESDDIWNERATEQIENLKAQKENAILAEIENEVEKVSGILKFEGEQITHYTSLTTSKFLIFKSSPLRAGEATFTNDPSEGTAFVSIKNEDKTPQMIEAVQILKDAGFNIVATRGTAGFLKAAGIHAETVNKVYEGRPNVVDRLRDGDINLVFNTTEGAASIDDSREIRSVALYGKIVYYTTAAASYAAARAIRNIREGALEISPLQSY